MRTVLVVEDDWVVLESLRKILQAECLEVLVAPEPTATIARLKARTADVTMTDFFAGMSPETCQPSADGLLAAARGVPVLGVTGRPFDRAIPVSAFGDDIVAKPFDVNDLVKPVQALLLRPKPGGLPGP